MEQLQLLVCQNVELGATCAMSLRRMRHRRAMGRVDPATGRPRGFMRLGLQPRLDSVLFTLDVRDEAWHQARDYLEARLRLVVAAAAAAPGATAESVVHAAAEAAPHLALKKFIAVRTAGSSMHGGVCTQRRAIDLFLRELRGMPLHAAAAPGVPPASPVDISGSNCWDAAPGGSRAGEQRADEGNCAAALDVQQQAGQQQGSAAAAGALGHQEGMAASSRHAMLASSAEPAVKEDLSVERACMLLCMAPK